MRALLARFNINTFHTEGNVNIFRQLNETNIYGYQFFNAINLAKRMDSMYTNEMFGRQRTGQFYSIFNGAKTNGESRFIGPTVEKDTFSYSAGMDYYDNFASKPSNNPKTQSRVSHDGYQSGYVDIYTKKDNYYPDELDALTGYDNVIEHNNTPDSILTKTKELFHQKKINTIISSFHTNNFISPDESDSATTYGLSHGRNLLTKGAEDNNDVDTYNGYDNPYCRVWTHHYKYDKFYKMVRPFTTDNNGSPEATKLKDLHTWNSLFKPPEGKKWQDLYDGWKNNNPRWDESVLRETGHINITPKFGVGGKDSIHTKQCMFSIENLAWKGLSPYEFEKNLSWEQRGPMGGRIMWFPPYGITFQETTNAKWSSNEFIGRGEGVYTYVNTTRTGTLSFLMVVTHPSVLDYSTHYRNGEQHYDALRDSDILRYFAGCDTGVSKDTPMHGTGDEQRDGWDSLNAFTKPPEYTVHESSKPEVPEEVIEPPKEVPKPIVKPPKEKLPTVTKELVFYVFYPNNYSGMYDYPSVKSSSVDFAAYLINGVGTNKLNTTSADILKLDNKDIINNTKDVEINHSTYAKLNNKNGYEIYSGSGIGNKTDGKVGKEYSPICGTSKGWYYYNALPKSYPINKRNLYHYRPDGHYNVPKSKNDPDMYKNTYDDQLRGGNYEDKKSFGLNSSVGYNIVKSTFNHDDETKPSGDRCLYAFTEIAAALYHKQYGENFKNASIIDNDRYNALIDIFDNYEIVEVSGFGGASGHATTRPSQNNQVNLCESRYKSVREWLKIIPDSPFKDSNIKWNGYAYNDIQNKLTSSDVSSQLAKLGRYAKIVIKVKTDKTNQVDDVDIVKPEDIDRSLVQEHIIETKDGTTLEAYEKEEEVKSKKNEVIKSGQSETDLNWIRYDQEYRFFKELKIKDPLVFDNLMQKLQYFDPAFHSTTPEGFNSRLTFLQQCTRQGNTIGATNKDGQATNLAFGRAPYCVLRLGDFYNQMIAIESINITYDTDSGVQWDINPEGNGVQPLLARVSLNFNFLGGGDMYGPIRRLQNAMTFNYYANTGLYDNRADYEKRYWNNEIADAFVDGDEVTNEFHYLPVLDDRIKK